MNQIDATSDRLQRLEQLVPLCESIRKGSEYRAALAQAAGEVRQASTLTSRLASTDAPLRLLCETEHVSRADLIADLEKVETAGRALQQSVNTEALRDARFSVKDAQEAVERIEALLLKGWNSLLSEEFGPLQRMGQVLSEIPDTRMIGIELQKWATRALEISRNGLPTTDSLKRFNAIKAERTTRLESLGQLGIDASVRSFLADVAYKRATLDSVNPEVLHWLRAKNARSRFRVDLT
jgi:hypothetical protein